MLISLLVCYVLYQCILYLRVEWFWRKKLLCFLHCAKLLKDPDSKISCLYVAFSFVAGLLSQKFYCCPKISNTIFYLTFNIVQIKNSLAHFWKDKRNIKQILISNLFLAIVLLCIRKVYENLLHIFSFYQK